MGQAIVAVENRNHINRGNRKIICATRQYQIVRNELSVAMDY
jgi:hypothetical protein